MKNNNGQTWLFSFTDLAFLLLISLSTIPVADSVTIRFSEMDVPVVPESQQLGALGQLREVWELQVHPVSEEYPVPYKIARFGLASQVDGEEVKLLSSEQLLGELANLKARNIRPMLLPEKTSLTQDLLYAAGSMAKLWGEAYGETVVQPEILEEGP
ncbi:MAG: hypothetical protein K8R55_07750 [Desulfuromonadaceae bacterium]|nr:hypothetical protein [Desulfuromonadaceae bacterium]